MLCNYKLPINNIKKMDLDAYSDLYSLLTSPKSLNLLKNEIYSITGVIPSNNLPFLIKKELDIAKEDPLRQITPELIMSRVTASFANNYAYYLNDQRNYTRFQKQHLTRFNDVRYDMKSIKLGRQNTYPFFYIP